MSGSTKSSLEYPELSVTKENLDLFRRFGEMLDNLSSRFVNIAPDKVDMEITQSLTQIRQFFGVDRCAFLEVLKDCGSSRGLFEADDETSPHETFSVASHPWAYHRLIEQKIPVALSSLDELPPEAETDRISWLKTNVSSMLIIPIHLESRITHLFGLYVRQPGHQWTDDHIRRLNLLGGIFNRALIHKHDQDLLIKGQRLLSEAERIAHLGSYTWNVKEGTHIWSDEFYRIFGYQPNQIQPTYEAFLAGVHQDDRDRVHEANLACTADPGKKYSIEYRVVRPDSVERIVYARAKVHLDENRKPLNMIGTVQDITEIKHVQNALDKAFHEIKQLKEQLEAENIYLRREVDTQEGFGDIVGVSNAIKYVIHRIRQVACTKTTVLLLGETGTGKSVFARNLHEASDRRNKTFVKVNCASLPPNLIESELFGREKGAFTGSTARQIGRFELANSGTIFLDEIGELPLDLQTKLLKVIEEGEFERLGSPRSYKCDVRIISSTNRDLEEEINKGNFRRDLFYRLNVFPITIPPLRQRKEDIAPLARFFVEKFNRGMGKNISRISAGAIKKMEDYEWQGNVRELMNVIERAVILSDGPELEVAITMDIKTAGSPGDQGGTSSKTAVSKELLNVEREHIRTILEESGWRVEGPKGAATKLGLNPSTLRARMKKLSIKRP